MKWCMRVGVSLAVCWAVVAVAAAQAPPARPPAKPKVEFRWLEDKPIKGVTEDKGIRTSCGDELSYPHKTPVLTGDAVAGTRVSKITFNPTTNPQDMFSVDFELTADAKAKLAADRGPGGTGLLGVYVDGAYWSLAYFQERTKATFEPSAGYFTSRAEVDRITGAFK